MAGKIKFPLKMGDGAEVRTIEELREHFDLAAVLGYYENGKLAEWLIDRYYEVEAEKIKALDSSSNEFKRNLCEIFEVPYSEAEADDVDLAKIAAKNGRYERLKQFTADDTILAAVDSVAFSQEELADLLDEDAKLIYLCGKRFKVPCSKGGVTYIGVNNPVVDVDKGYDEKGIVFKGVQGKNILDDSIKNVSTVKQNSVRDLPKTSIKKAAKGENINTQLRITANVVNKASPKFRLIVNFICESDDIARVSGVLDKGSVRINDEVMITKTNGTSFKSVVLRIEIPSNLFNLLGFERKISDETSWDQWMWFAVKPIDYAEEGDRVGLYLKDTKMKDFSIGDVVTRI